MTGEKEREDEDGLVEETADVTNDTTDELEETPSAKDVARLRERAAKADEFEESWLRAAADLQNIQRRATRDKDLARRMAVRDLISSLLPCFDNLERAVSSADEGTMDVLVQGVSMVSSEIVRVLSDHGVKLIEASEDERLDPTRHEAVFSRHADDVEENVILEVLEKGYAIGETIIRPARVTVSLGPAPEETDDGGSEAPQED